MAACFDVSGQIIDTVNSKYRNQELCLIIEGNDINITCEIQALNYHTEIFHELSSCALPTIAHFLNLST